MITEDKIVAAAGIGIPLKDFEPGAPVCTLKRASLKAPHATNKKAAAHPSLPKGPSAHLYIMIEGATPKATRSDSESSSMPKRVEVLVSRAIQPSRPSKILATTMAQAA